MLPNPLSSSCPDLQLLRLFSLFLFPSWAFQILPASPDAPSPSVLSYLDIVNLDLTCPLVILGLFMK